MLLERRDIERETPTDDAQLTRKDKELLLQELAYWLLRNNRSDAERAEAARCLERQLGFMQRIKSDGSTVLQYLLERSGLIREPVPDRVDFIHRTFQEYLGAKAAIEDQDIGALVDKAHLDQWREVIILAAGHASRPDREKLLRGLLRRTWRPRYRNRLNLLAVACLETGAVSPELMETLKARLDRLIPPRNMADAKAIAAAGEVAISYLSGHGHKSSEVVAASVRALSLIGGDPALRILKEYGSDSREDVVAELLLAWDAFDQEAFAREIVRHGRYVVFQLAEVAVPRALFAEILRRIERLRPRPPPFSA